LDIYGNYVEDGALTDARSNEHSKGPGQEKLGFSAESELRCIAERSSKSTNNSVNNQDAARHQAAFVAKNKLAQAAAEVIL